MTSPRSVFLYLSRTADEYKQSVLNWSITIAILIGATVCVSAQLNEPAPRDGYSASAQVDVRVDRPTSLVRNLGYQVNSKYEELNPIISADGRTIYFARKYCPTNVGGRPDPQDIWKTSFEDGRWGTSINLGRVLNTSTADNLCAISADSREMYYFVKKGNDRGYFGVRVQSESGWSTMQPIGLEIENESAFLEASITADTRAVLFTAKSKQNIAYNRNKDERDIYVCLRTLSGKWSDPINLGSVINTEGDEFSPFLAADGRTLYFASNGREGYGDADIFVSRRMGEGWSTWTEPENLGPSINSFGFDGYFSIDISGNRAFMATTRNSFGKTDLVQVMLPERLRPEPRVVVSASFKDRTSGNTVRASVNTSGMSECNVHASGSFSGVITPNTTGTLEITASGFITERRIITPGTDDRVIQLDILLTPMASLSPLVIPNVQFDEGRAHLRPEARLALDSVAGFLMTNTSVAVLITGHTDNRGDRKSLYQLSLNRADAVKQYLCSRGISEKRIKVKGSGPASPIARNDLPEEQMKNRRVELVILKW